MIKKKCALTLVELMVSVIIVSIIVLSLYGILNSSYLQMTASVRRTKVQSDLAFALEHMSKYVQLGIGTAANHALSYTPIVTPTGFSVRVDLNSPSTPASFVDDAIISYTISGNTLSASCSGTNCPFTSQVLSSLLLPGFSLSLIPAVPTMGFYAVISAAGNQLTVGLAGRFNPALAASFQNPQIVNKTRLICSSCSSN